jgi:hypothetical protein
MPLAGQFRGAATVRLKDMRVGLERANSCHDHDGFQASPHQSFWVYAGFLSSGSSQSNSIPKKEHKA